MRRLINESNCRKSGALAPHWRRERSIASILIAFGIDAWWDYQQDRRAEREVLVDLEEEFERIVESVARRTEGFESSTQDMEWLLNLSLEETDVPVERLTRP